jgi:hypothetical protein
MPGNVFDMTDESPVFVNHHNRSQIFPILGTGNIGVDVSPRTGKLHHFRRQAGIIRIDDIVYGLSHCKNPPSTIVFGSLTYNENLHAGPVLFAVNSIHFG